jgi:branched-chain amino acid aminotransferase
MERVNIDWKNLPFNYYKTDCHLEYYFRNGKWDTGEVITDDILKLPISATCLHYGQEAFEGIKVFEQKDGKISVFRVEENARRMIRSAEKILMAPFPENMFVDAVLKLVKLNKKYIPPHGSGASLYIRPLLLGISNLLGVRPSSDYLFVVFASPVGPYFKTGLKPIKLYVEESMDRAAPDGVGDVKVGGNYAASLRVSNKVKNLGFDEVLYLDSKHKKYIDESGPANFFGITKDNKYVTPDSDSILPSITNKSLMVLAQEELGLKVEKRHVNVKEIFDFKEAGCCGTAAVITPVKSITYKNQTVTYCTGEETGPVCQSLYDKLTSIQIGLSEDLYGWNTEIQVD